VPRVVVPTESEERVADQSHQRKRTLLTTFGLVVLLIGGAIALTVYRERSTKANADTTFVSAPAWPKAAPKIPSKGATQPTKEWLLQVGAYTNRKRADTLAARLEGLAWPVSVVVPVSATDSLNKVIVSGIMDRATAKRVADSLSGALGRPVQIIEPLTLQAK
jgi:cell division septation protein DedD